MPTTRLIHRILLLIGLFAGLGLGLGAQEAGEADYNKLIVEVLEGYQELFSVRLDADVEDKPGFSWYVTSQAISQGFLRFTVEPVNNDLLTGARFHAVPGQDTTYIILSQQLLDAWGVSPSLAYTLITGAIRDAANFFRDPPAWGLAQADLMEKFFLDLDISNTEALLIRDRLLPSGFLLSGYEAFLLDSFEKDDLASASLYLDAVSLPVAQGLYGARVTFEGNNDADGLRTLLTNLAEELLSARDGVPSGSADEEVYPLAVAIHTWLEFSPVMISRIHNRDRQENPLSFDEVLRREPAYAEARRLLEASRTRDMPMMEHVNRESRKGFASL